MTGDARSGASTGLVAGLLLGAADGAFALYNTPLLAGPWIDRIGTLAVAMTLYAALLALLGAAVGLVWARVSTTHRGDVDEWRRAFRPRAIAALTAGFAAVCGASIGCGGAGRPAQDLRPNVVLISVDTLRADRLGSYGNPRSPSPHLDELARNGVLFEDAYSHSAWTLPAHVSALTGLDPFAHGVVTEDDRLGDEFVTLAEMLRDAGFWTGAWVGTPPFGFVGARYGLDQGFESYRHDPHPRRFGGSLVARLASRALDENILGRLGAGSHLTNSVLTWLGGARHEPFFLFVHYYDVHSKFAGLPYEAPQPFRDRYCPQPDDGYRGCRDGLCATHRLNAMATGQQPRPDAAELERLRCLYDGGVAYVDQEIGRILEALEREQLADRTLVIVTSDHGEAFFEHGMPLHVTLHEEILRVPMIVRLPGGVAGKRVRGAVRLIDLAPTILDVTGIDPVSPLQGVSLANVLRSWPDTPARVPVLAADHRSDSVALVRGNEKYLRNGNARRLRPLPAIERYDLASDPGEQWNRAPRDPPEKLAELDETLARLTRSSKALHRALADASAPEPVALDADERELLRALGYTAEEDE